MTGGVGTWWGHYIRNSHYADGGRDLPGVDCYGLARAIYETELGITLPAWPKLRLDDIAEQAGSLLDSSFTGAFKAVQTGLEEAFDMAVIRRPLPVNNRLVKGWWHLGVVTRPAHILHMNENQGAIETCFRDTAQALASATLREGDVRLFRHPLRSGGGSC